MIPHQQNAACLVMLVSHQNPALSMHRNDFSTHRYAYCLKCMETIVGTILSTVLYATAI
jgi:uncharacterized membrane protein